MLHILRMRAFHNYLRKITIITTTIHFTVAIRTIMAMDIRATIIIHINIGTTHGTIIEFMRDTVSG